MTSPVERRCYLGRCGADGPVISVILTEQFPGQLTGRPLGPPIELPCPLDAPSHRVHVLRPVSVSEYAAQTLGDEDYVHGPDDPIWRAARAQMQRESADLAARARKPARPIPLNREFPDRDAWIDEDGTVHHD